MGWKAPNNPTGPAKLVYAKLFPKESWPKGWHVQWVGFMRGVLGLTIWNERRILLSYGDAKSRRGHVLRTLVHEFVHMRAGKELRHGREFTCLERRMLAKLKKHEV